MLRQKCCRLQWILHVKWLFHISRCLWLQRRVAVELLLCFLPRDANAMHKRGLCRHAVSVCVSITFVSCVKTNKDIFEIFSPSGSQAILVFPYQMGWRYSDGNPLTGASNVRGVGINAILDEYLASLHTGLHFYQPYESRSVKKPRRTAASVEQSTYVGVRRPLFAQYDDEVFVTGSTLYAGDGGQPSLTGWHNPLGHNSVFCCSGTS